MKDLNLENLTTEEIKEMIKKLQQEIKNRELKVIKKYTTYESDFHDKSNHAVSKYKAWVKVVSNINLTQNGGYIFEGNFLKVKEKYEIEVGSIVVEHFDNEFTFYRIEEKEKVLIDKVYREELKRKVQQLMEEGILQ